MAMEQAFELNPKLWQNLPPDLVDIIVEKVLITLPFSKVLRFCFLSKRSRAFLLSTQYLLYLNKSDECATFNPRTSLWESMPLRLSQTQALTLRHMELVYSDEGLLYFATAERDKVLFYNLLNGRCRESLRAPDATQLISSAEHRVSQSSPLQWDILKRERPQVPTSGMIVTIIALSDTGFFALFVFKGHRAGTPLETLRLNDSRRGSWVCGPEVEREFHFLAFPTFYYTARQILVGFQPCSVESPNKSPENSFDMLLYDVLEQRCRWQHVLSFPELVNVRVEKRLLATVTGGGELEFLEFLDGGKKLVKAARPPPPVVLRGNASFRFVRLIGADNIKYYIGLFRHQAEGQAIGGPVNISVRTQNLVTGVEHISNWTECPYSGVGLRLRPFELPSSRNFHVLRPRWFPI